MAEAMIDPDYRETHTLPPLPRPPSSAESMLGESERREDVEGTKSPEKTVVINEPPAKRLKSVETVAPIGRVIEGLNFSVSQADRINAMSTALASFDHGVQSTHDEEISSGADTALCKHLAFLLYKSYCEEEKDRIRIYSAKREDEDDGNVSTETPELVVVNSEGLIEEIGQTCEAIEAIYRGSANSVSSSFSRVGSELLPMVIKIVDREIHRRKEESRPVPAGKERYKTGDGAKDAETSPEPAAEQNEPPSDARDLLLRKSTKIIGHFARVGSLTQSLAYHPGLLSTLKRIIACPVGFVPRECRLNALWIIANLACNAENMVMMACHPGLMDTLVRPVFRPIEDEEDDIGDIDEYMGLLRGRDIAVRAILNLSWAPENKLMLSEHVNLVEALTRTLLYRMSSWAGFGRGVSGILLQSRRHAAGALRNLAAAPRRNKINLCRLGGGALLDKVTDAARNDPDSEVRGKAIATLHNLACSCTADDFVRRSNVLELLADAALLDGDTSTLASHTLRVLEKSIPEDMEGYSSLKPYLDRVAAAKPT